MGIVGHFCLLLLLLSVEHVRSRRATLPPSAKDISIKGCPSPGINTASRPNMSLSLAPPLRTWPTLSQFTIQKGNERIHLYRPSNDVITIDSNRFTIVRFARRTTFTYQISFNPNEDAGEEIEFTYWRNRNEKGYNYCKIFVNEDLTPQALLTRQSPPEMGIRDKNMYTEGDRCIIICRILKIRLNDTFKIIFPPATDKKLESNATDRISYQVKLIKSVKNANISCVIPNGYSITRSDLLVFKDKIVTQKPEDKTTLAISIAVLFGLMLVVMLPVGAYMLIIKQRKDNTKQMVEHHAQEAQTRMQTQLTQMSRMSRMSRMSKMDEPEGKS